MEDGPFKSLQGQLLIDGGSLAGSFFNRTVVLLCQHNEEGAFGLVLNRPMDKTVGEMIVEDLPERIQDQDLSIGGPVQGQAMSFLHSDDYLPDANVIPNLNLEHSIDELLEIGNSFSPTSQVRIFAGYSGWGAGQLEDEMKRNSWLTHSASIEHVFAIPPEQLWREVMLEMGGVNRLMADAPDDLSWN
ncbi:MAG: YqgE/AlgH family protein [Limisphaerales bacterium]